MKIERVSLLSGKTSTREIDASPTKIANYLLKRDTRFIQDIFPELSKDDREFLMTGITPEEWKEMIDETEYIEGGSLLNYENENP